MIPIADQNPVRRIPVVTLLLIAACVVLYFTVQPTGAPKIQWNEVVERLDEEDLRFVVDNAAIPCELVKGRPLTEQEFHSGTCSDEGGRSHAPGKSVFLAILTSMFLHGSVAHLFGNMLFLWVFGNNVEERAGWWRYLLLYLVGGAVATAAHVAVSPNSTIPIIGASGAIAAVVGAYFVLWPSARIKTVIVILPVFLRKVMALWLLVAWLGQNFLLVGGNSGVAWAAHVGGFAFGALVGLWWRAQDRRREAAPSFPVAPAPA
ncbi:MAG: rhomboid family intramembrane serine protease [Acidimicrobiia bacterium]